MKENFNNSQDKIDPMAFMNNSEDEIVVKFLAFRNLNPSCSQRNDNCFSCWEKVLSR